MSVATYDTPRKSTVRNDTRTPWKSASTRTPCTICGAKKYCEYKDDGTIHCMSADAARVPGARPCNSRNGGFIIAPDTQPAHAVRLLPSRPPPAADADTLHVPPDAAADADTLHVVYTSLREMCPLAQSHGALLASPAHGLAPAQARRYGTLPSDTRAVCATLAARHGRDTLLSVPGFIEKDGKIEARGAGIILPTRDVQGRIVAIDVRRERVAPGEGKYYKLSCGSIGGPNAGTPAHVARPSTVREARTVYVTEGVKKADVAADALGCVVIGLAGHTTWRHALTALDEMAEVGASECVIALDRDANPETVEKVDASRLHLAQAAVELGYAVRFAVWDPATAKGLDDLVQAGLTPMRERYRPVFAEGEANAQTAAQYSTVQAKLDDVTRLMNTPHMRPTDKLLAHAVWTVTNQYPSACGDDLPPPIRLDRNYLGGHAGVSESTVTKALPDLAELGIIRREVRRDKATGLSELWVGGGSFPETPWTKEELQTAGRAKDRARKVCPACGSTHLAAHALICEDCNTICTPEQAGDAGEAAARAAHVAERERFMREDADAGQGASGPETVTRADGRVVDVETGEILVGGHDAGVPAIDTTCDGATVEDAGEPPPRPCPRCGADAWLDGPTADGDMWTCAECGMFEQPVTPAAVGPERTSFANLAPEQRRVGGQLP